MSLWNTVVDGDAEVVDPSIGLEPDASEPFPPEIEYGDHAKGAELLAGNFDELPRRTDVPFVTFPVEIEGWSAGWVRPVAIVEGDG